MLKRIGVGVGAFVGIAAQPAQADETSLEKILSVVNDWQLGEMSDDSQGTIGLDSGRVQWAYNAEQEHEMVFTEYEGEDVVRALKLDVDTLSVSLEDETYTFTRDEFKQTFEKLRELFDTSGFSEDVQTVFDHYGLTAEEILNADPLAGTGQPAIFGYLFERYTTHREALVDHDTIRLTDGDRSTLLDYIATPNNERFVEYVTDDTGQYTEIYSMTFDDGSIVVQNRGPGQHWPETVILDGEEYKEKLTELKALFEGRSEEDQSTIDAVIREFMVLGGSKEYKALQGVRFRDDSTLRWDEEGDATVYTKRSNGQIDFRVSVANGRVEFLEYATEVPELNENEMQLVGQTLTELTEGPITHMSAAELNTYMQEFTQDLEGLSTDGTSADVGAYRVSKHVNEDARTITFTYESDEETLAYTFEVGNKEVGLSQDGAFDVSLRVTNLSVYESAYEFHDRFFNAVAEDMPFVRRPETSPDTPEIIPHGEEPGLSDIVLPDEGETSESDPGSEPPNPTLQKFERLYETYVTGVTKVDEDTIRLGITDTRDRSVYLDVIQGDDSTTFEEYVLVEGVERIMRRTTFEDVDVRMEHVWPGRRPAKSVSLASEEFDAKLAALLELYEGRTETDQQTIDSFIEQFDELNSQRRSKTKDRVTYMDDSYLTWALEDDVLMLKKHDEDDELQFQIGVTPDDVQYITYTGTPPEMDDDETQRLQMALTELTLGPITEMDPIRFRYHIRDLLRGFEAQEVDGDVASFGEGESVERIVDEDAKTVKFTYTYTEGEETHVSHEITFDMTNHIVGYKSDGYDLEVASGGSGDFLFEETYQLNDRFFNEDDDDIPFYERPEPAPRTNERRIHTVEIGGQTNANAFRPDLKTSRDESRIKLNFDDFFTFEGILGDTDAESTRTVSDTADPMNTSSSTFNTEENHAYSIQNGAFQFGVPRNHAGKLVYPFRISFENLFDGGRFIETETGQSVSDDGTFTTTTDINRGVILTDSGYHRQLASFDIAEFMIIHAGFVRYNQDTLIHQDQTVTVSDNAGVLPDIVTPVLFERNLRSTQGNSFAGLRLFEKNVEISFFKNRFDISLWDDGSGTLEHAERRFIDEYGILMGLPATSFGFNENYFDFTAVGAIVNEVQWDFRQVIAGAAVDPEKVKQQLTHGAIGLSLPQIEGVGLTGFLGYDTAGRRTLHGIMTFGGGEIDRRTQYLRDREVALRFMGLPQEEQDNLYGMLNVHEQPWRQLVRHSDAWFIGEADLAQIQKGGKNYGFRGRGAIKFNEWFSFEGVIGEVKGVERYAHAGFVFDFDSLTLGVTGGYRLDVARDDRNDEYTISATVRLDGSDSQKKD